jgi:DNA-binding CsgD family transcriptional regulator
MADANAGSETPPRSDPEPLAWVLISGGNMPEEWRARAQQVNLVPLLPEEVAGLFEGRDPDRDDDLLRLVAQGSTTEQIARKLDLSRRTVERHLARLRERYDQPTTAALSSFLARRGF